MLIYLLAATQFDRQATATALRHELDRQVAFESGFAPVEIWTAMRGNPDLALVNADRVTAETRDAVQMIPRLRKQTRVLILGAAVEPAGWKCWADCGISGYVIKDGGIEELRNALTAMEHGEPYYSRGVIEVLQERPKAADRPALSRREAELLPLLAQGMKLRDAASRMTVSYKTADSYRTSLLRKLGMRDRVDLVRYAIREGLVDA
ncbi:MAG: response regulator transcription factor [Planctomycetes bacterium]|nr:response regulator transcription factor [Planctomycetota bacterium]